MTKYTVGELESVDVADLARQAGFVVDLSECFFEGFGGADVPGYSASNCAPVKLVFFSLGRALRAVRKL